MRQIITHFTDDDLYKYTMCCAVIENFPRTQVKYTFFDRNNTLYPKGFAEELMAQIEMLEGLRITKEEIEFMHNRCKYLPVWFLNYLRGFRYDHHWVKVRQDRAGRLGIEFEGPWSSTILLEVKVLAIISELYYMMTGQDAKLDYEAFYERTAEKASRLIEGGCTFSEIGTRRRATFEAQDTAVRALKDSFDINAPVCFIGSDEMEGFGRFVGTSNVYLAMKYDLTPIGTMAHELICAIAGMYGPQMANHLAMRAWSNTYRGSLGTYLYDTYGWQIFSLNFSEDFANMFKGLRVDSGDNKEQLDLIVDKYRSLGIDPSTKQVIFSNALSVDKAIDLQKYAYGKCQPGFAIGTHFTNDFQEVDPLNIVIKLTSVKITETWPFWCPTCKLSADPEKNSGSPAIVAIFKKLLHISTAASAEKPTEEQTA